MRAKAIRRSALLAMTLIAAIFALHPAAQQQQLPSEAGRPPAAAGLALVPTTHPLVPRDPSSLWFAPAAAAGSRASSVSQFAAAMKLVDDERYSEALPALSRLAAQQGPLGDYAAYYAALARQRLGSCQEAREMFRSVQQRQASGYLSEAAALAEAECAKALGDYSSAVVIYERMTERKTSAPEDVWMRLGGAAKATGDSKRAWEAFARVYFDYPLSAQAPAAGSEYSLLSPSLSAAARFKLELKRAERLFAAGRYADARTVFTKVGPNADGDDSELVRLRLAQCDYQLKRTRAAREAMRPLIGRGPRQAEALFYYGLALRRLGEKDSYEKTLRRVVDEFPSERWAEEALDNLGTYYILEDDDDQADDVFRELYTKYPKSSYAERAAWKVGWRAYRQGRYADVIPVFESAAVSFPRSNYRPGWLYWSGRAYETLDNKLLATDRYMLTAGDYLNSYYGRLAVKQLGGRMPPPRVMSDQTNPAPLPNEAVVRALLSVARYDDALSELRYAQRTWGESAPVTATMAWIYRQQGQSRSGSDQFNLLRGSITLMRRAYPQFMAAGGEELPRDVLLHIFPLDYWDLIRKYAAKYSLDEYLLAALVAQESTFVPEIRSSAGAVGLMQLMPATGRAYARKLKLTYSRKLLTNPEANVRMGTAYLADKLEEFRAPYLALASYNAGEAAVRRWIAERPEVADPSEFIEDIPYFETQNYVKRILGTADDYRRLYGPAAQSRRSIDPSLSERVNRDAP